MTQMWADNAVGDFKAMSQDNVNIWVRVWAALVFRQELKKSLVDAQSQKEIPMVCLRETQSRVYASLEQSAGRISIKSEENIRYKMNTINTLAMIGK